MKKKTKKQPTVKLNKQKQLSVQIEKSIEYERTIRELKKTLKWAHMQASLWYGFFGSKCNARGRKTYQKMLDKCQELSK